MAKIRVAQLRVYPYKQGSKSAKTLAEALGGKVLKHVGSKYKPRAGDLVINWGSSDLPAFGGATTLNPSAAIKVAACKLASFVKLDEAGVRVPEYVCDHPDLVPLGREMLKKAAEKLQFPVVCRTKLRGHSGEGIVIANNAKELVDAPLYTQYVKKKDEYRVHVVSDRAIYVQRKARKLDVEAPNWQVRNLVGGFVFCEVAAVPIHDDENAAWDCPTDVIDQAIKAVAALNLDFGGVDVMWNEKEQKAYVLEINTACGLEDRTAQRYAEEFHNLLQDQGR